MVTNDERRAAANTIRRYNGQANCMYLVKYAACRGDLDASESAFLNRLADLIEPEPERKRSINADWLNGDLEHSVYRCSACGAVMLDDACYFYGSSDLDWFHYCPSCGAKVVDE